MKTHLLAPTLVFGVVLSACKGGELEITLIDDCPDEGGVSFKEEADYVQVVAFRNKCPPDEDLQAGIVEGAVAQKVADVDSPPALGKLKSGKYGFAVLLRDQSCGVIGFGCTDRDGEGVDIKKINRVNIRVGAFGNDAGFCVPFTGGGCPMGRRCDEGRCLPSEDDVPEGCELDLLASDTFPDPLPGSVKVLGPGVATTPTGFAIGYREYDTSAGMKRISVVHVMPDGEVSEPVLQGPESSCEGEEPSDGVGLAFNRDDGMLVASDPDCNSSDDRGAGASLLDLKMDNGEADIDSIGKVETSRSSVFFRELELAQVHSVAMDPRAIGAGDFLFAYQAILENEDGDPEPQIQVGVLNGANFKGGTGPVPIFEGETVEFAQVAGASNVLAVLGRLPTSVSLLVGEPSEGLPPPHEVELSDTDVDWAALVGWDDRVAGVVPASSGANWLVVNSAGESLSNGSLTGSNFRAADVAVSGDHLVIVSGKSGGLTAYRIDGASGDPASTPELTQSLTPSDIGALEQFDGNQLAVAAGHDKVLIAWTSQQVLDTGDPAGGWALLQCSAEGAGSSYPSNTGGSSNGGGGTAGSESSSGGSSGGGGGGNGGSAEGGADSTAGGGGAGGA